MPKKTCSLLRPALSVAAAISFSAILLHGTSGVLAAEPSIAHQKSRFAIIDPAYNALKITPEPDRAAGVPWIYGESEVETWRHQRVCQRGFAACTLVGYPGDYHRPSTKASFVRPVTASDPWPTRLVIRTTGLASVKVNGIEVARVAESETPTQIKLPEKPGDLRIDVQTDQSLPGLLIPTGPFSTTSGWLWSAHGQDWQPAVTWPQTRSKIPPHGVEEPTLVLKPVAKNGDLFDFGREITGWPIFRCPGQPSLVVGESPAEALTAQPEKNTEQKLSIHRLPNGSWTSDVALAFRYLRVRGGAPSDVSCRASFHPMRYRGAFACSDERLTRIWMNSAYTMRLCIQGLVLDGVKRDRMPWIGDTYVSLQSIAYAFGDLEIARNGLTSLGRAGISKSDINGIVDSSLWWVISHDQAQRYAPDTDYLRREWPRIQDLLTRMAARCDGEGFLRPETNAWVFIDWPVSNKMDKKKVLVPLQIMWYWAQRCGAQLAQRAGDQTSAAVWRTSAESLAKLLHQRAWNSALGGWLTYVDEPGEISFHANVLAVDSGLAHHDQFESIRRMVVQQESSIESTPFYKSLAELAVIRLGAFDAVSQSIRDYWGGMLDEGATTFWETYSPSQKGSEKYAMYGRPFANSLCHGWASAPVFLLPVAVLGIEPKDDGWSRFSVEPHLGSLEWASSCTPTPHGDIRVDANHRQVTIHFPAGTTLELGDRSITGPATEIVRLPAAGAVK